MLSGQRCQERAWASEYVRLALCADCLLRTGDNRRGVIAIDVINLTPSHMRTYRTGTLSPPHINPLVGRQRHFPGAHCPPYGRGFLTVKEGPEVLVVSFHQPLDRRGQNFPFLNFCVHHGALQQPENKERSRAAGEKWRAFPADFSTGATVHTVRRLHARLRKLTTFQP